jgi:DNA-binding MarR family transcriptional regulator
VKHDLSGRFGFLVQQVAKMYGDQFDRLARAQIGLSIAQCRILGALAMHDTGEPISQTELAKKVGLSAMSVASACDRMEAAGWLRRAPSETDRRINHIELEPRAERALEAALALSDELRERALAALTAAERKQLIALLGKARNGLLALEDEGAP